ncbi:MAG: cellulase family glycosylhydrolase, partial [Oscillospiraceae bacterium]
MFSLAAVNASAATTKGVTLSKTSAGVTVGKYITLKPTVTGYKKYTLVWSTSDKSVATVAAGGKVTGKKAGTATITVKIKGTSYKATCKVTVKNASTSTTTTTATTTAKTTASSGNAMEFVQNIKIGWNLGNTLDSTGTWISGSPTKYETAWGNVVTTEDMIKTVKNAGFNAVRIPTTWGDHIDSSNKIDEAWMKRVKEVVDYAIKNDMYVILNLHHENSWLKLTDKEKAAAQKKFKAVWEQICTTFKNYDEHLIFEAMNEPRTEGSAQEWNGGTTAEREAVNEYNQLFVDTVRASGGNNKTRYLMVTPYAASSSPTALKALKVPDDDRVIVSVHAYTPYNMALNCWSDEKTFTSSGKNEVDYLMKNINDIFISKGQAVIIGEFGSLNKENEAERVKLAKYYVSEAKKLGVPCFWWDNGTKCAPSEGEGFGLLDRKTLKWWFSDLVKALTSAAK